eukprot:5775978-Pleurochrysis_carterae.AAC.7
MPVDALDCEAYCNSAVCLSSRCPQVFSPTFSSSHFAQICLPGLCLSNLGRTLRLPGVCPRRLMGAHGYPKKRLYKEKLRLKISAFCKSHSCPGAFPREIAELVHEEMHASLGWCASLLSCAFSTSGLDRTTDLSLCTVDVSRQSVNARVPACRYRIFPRVADYPASDARGYMNKFLSTPEWRSSFTPLDELMLKWLETRWWPKHVRDSNNTVHVYADN